VVTALVASPLCEGLPTKYMTPNTCDESEDYHRILHRRYRNWKESGYLRKNQLWQNSVNHKMIGYIFARSYGVGATS